MKKIIKEILRFPVFVFWARVAIMLECSNYVFECPCKEIEIGLNQLVSILCIAKCVY
ncbi:hypothetical protein PGB90_003663 [Kerria lacca]